MKELRVKYKLLLDLSVFLAYVDSLLRYALTLHNEDIIDFLGVVAFLIPTMDHDDVWC